MINYFIVDKYLEDWTLHIFFDDIIKIEPFKDERGDEHTLFYVIGDDEFKGIYILDSFEMLRIDEYDEFVALGDGSYATKKHRDMIPYLPKPPKMPTVK